LKVIEEYYYMLFFFYSDGKFDDGILDDCIFDGSILGDSSITILDEVEGILEDGTLEEVVVDEGSDDDMVVGGAQDKESTNLSTAPVIGWINLEPCFIGAEGWGCVGAFSRPDFHFSHKFFNSTSDKNNWSIGKTSSSSSVKCSSSIEINFSTILL